jgi:hypothetical protein
VAKRKLSPRTVRRTLARDYGKLADARVKLAALETGGSPERPMEVESASVIEPHALSMPCLRCEGTLRLEEHAATTNDGARLRVVRMRCALCGTRREVWFRIAMPS